MGNKFSASSGDSNSYLSCFGCAKSSKSSKKLKREADVLPEDLHANSGQECSVKQSHLGASDSPSPTTQSQRPTSLENYTIIHEESNTKFSAFPLHGVQKSSPSSPIKVDSFDRGNNLDNVDLKKIEKLYESYKDQSSVEDAILAEGVERFCLDLTVDPTEFIVLALAWKFKAETMCRFTRKEFTEGFLLLKCDSIERLKSTFKQIEADAADNFKDLYRYTFQFALDAEQGQRSLPCQIAIAMWNVVFSINPPSLLNSWLSYLQQHNVRGISRDTWNMFLYLVDSLDEDMSNYNDNEAWPSLFDDFVDHQKELRSKQRLEAKESDDPSLSLPHNLSSSNDISPKNSSTIEKSPDGDNEKYPDGNNEPLLRSSDIPGAIASSNEGSFQGEMSGDALQADRTLKEGDFPDDENGGKRSTPGELLSQLHADC